MAVHEAQAYKDNGSPEEQTRRSFLANATLVMGGIIGLTIAVPVAASLIPESLLKGGGSGTWAQLPPDEVAKLDKATEAPVKLAFNFKMQDGYLPPASNDEFVWGVKMPADKVAKFRESRPDLFKNPTGVAEGQNKNELIVMNFIVFSSICPHLGCRFNWVDEQHKFVCPCHGSQFTLDGEHVAGPAPRGLDPLPLRAANGKVEITWIQYKSNTADRIVVSYT